MRMLYSSERVPLSFFSLLFGGIFKSASRTALKTKSNFRNATASNASQRFIRLPLWKRRVSSSRKRVIMQKNIL